MSASLLPERHRVELVGLEEHDLCWPAAEKQARFASFRVRRGQQFAGVQATIQKPHGLEDLMVKLLQAIHSGGIKRWATIYKHLIDDVLPSQVDDALQILVGAGVIELHEKNQRPAKGEYWRIIEVSIDPRAQEEIEGLFPAKESRSAQQARLIAEVAALQSVWLPCDSFLAARVEELVAAGLRQLTEQISDPLFPIDPKAVVCYRSVLLTLTHARTLMARGEQMPLRTLSSILWDDTKILDRYQDMISDMLEADLGCIGITSHPELVWLYGGATYRLSGMEPVSLLCGRPMVLAHETVRDSDFRPSSKLQSILIIENLTAFLTVLDRTYYGREDVLVMWSGGYWSFAQRDLLAVLLAQADLSVKVWADMDGDGLLIAYQICEWVQRCGGRACPILMGEAEWRLAGGERLATERDLQIVSRPELRTLFPDLVPLLAKRKVTVEQERLLACYDHVARELP